jgi:Tfp pilus assembly protein PilN
MLATGIGSLGFGALIFPSLPLWAILTGLSIGATSLVGGKIEKQRREKSLLSQHKEEISAWFDQIQELAKKQINRQKEALEQDLLIIQEKGWSHYCEEIDIAWRASLNKTG